MNPTTQNITGTVDIEPITMSEVLELATWDRPRTNEELQDFISKREAALSGQ